MEEEVEDVYNGMQTHVLVQKQLQDVILTQQAAYDKLKQSVRPPVSLLEYLSMKLEVGLFSVGDI